jgi:hypothetical protein
VHRYLQFYLDLIATQDNVSLLHHLALKAKTVRDAESHSEVGCSMSEPMTTISFLTIFIRISISLPNWPKSLSRRRRKKSRGLFRRILARFGCLQIFFDHCLVQKLAKR